MQNFIGRPKGTVSRYNENPKFKNRGDEFVDHSVNEEAEDAEEIDELPEQTELSEADIIYQQHLPKRKLGAGCAIAVSEALTKGVPVTAPPIPAHTQSPQSADKKVRLSTDIRKSLYDRLRILGIIEHKTNIQIIEGWIETHCPELLPYQPLIQNNINPM